MKLEGHDTKLGSARALFAPRTASGAGLSLSSANPRMESLNPGSRIVNSKGVPGTLGCVARSLHNDQLLLLSTWHVLFGNHAAAGSRVWLHDSRDRFSEIGKSLYGKMGNVQYAGESCYIDCAVASCEPGVAGGRNESWSWPIDGCASVSPGSVLTKAGATSGLTQGIVANVNHSERISLSGRECVAQGQILVRALDKLTPFAVEGDSGAVVVNSSNHAVGLVWGTRVNGDAVVMPIAPVLFAMNITVGRPV